MDPHDVVRHRPLAFGKMEALVREMQDPEAGVPVGSQKVFLTHVPAAFMGYDLIEWLMERFAIEESEALSLGNQLCQYGYFFPVNDSKTLVIKDDSSLYRFQSPYYWPWQQRGAGGAAGTAAGVAAPSPTTHPDNVEYAVYLCKRSKRNRQRHVLEEYEAEALVGLRRNLQAKWDFITMQANEQVKLAKERKKGDKIVSDSQERAYWRVYRPPPGVSSALESCPIPSRCRNGPRCRRRDLEHCKKEVEFLKGCLSRTRVKVSVALDGLLQHAETFAEYDPLLVAAQPSNPWVTDDLTYWQINSSLVEVPTEKRVRRWAVSMEELVSDATGLHEFTAYLRKEYSHENIRFWMAANDLRRSAQSQIQRKVSKIYEEFLAAGAPCEINIDGKTQERVQHELKNPSRFTFDAAADHVYALLLKKDCYPRFIRSEHYKALIAAGKQPLQKKRFFGFGGPAKKKSSTTAPPVAALLQHGSGHPAGGPPLGRRRGSDRSLSGSAHELAVSGVRDAHHQKVPHSHSQSNLSDIPYRVEVSSSGGEEGSSGGGGGGGAVCPWEGGPERLEPTARSRNNSALDSCSSSSDISVAVADVSERLRLQQPAGPPARRLSAFEPRRGPTAAPGLRDDFPHRSFDSSTAPSPFARDRDDIPDEAKFKKGPGLLKSYSVSSAATTIAPVISVSSVSDDVPSESECDRARSPFPEDPNPSEGTTDSASTIGLMSTLSLASSPLTPSAPLPATLPTLLDVEEKSFKEDIEEITIVQSLVPDSSEMSGDAQKNFSVAVAPLAESEDAAEEDDAETADPTLGALKKAPQEAPVSITSGGGADTPAPADPTQTPRKDDKGNDICPWEDEETCKMDTPFVKTYATLGYL